MTPHSVFPPTEIPRAERAWCVESVGASKRLGHGCWLRSLSGKALLLAACASNGDKAYWTGKHLREHLRGSLKGEHFNPFSKGITVVAPELGAAGAALIAVHAPKPVA